MAVTTASLSRLRRKTPINHKNLQYRDVTPAQCRRVHGAHQWRGMSLLKPSPMRVSCPQRAERRGLVLCELVISHGFLHKRTGIVRIEVAGFRRNNLMQLPEFTHSTTLRWTVLVAGIFAAFIIVLLGFVYLKTKDDLTMRSDRVIASQIGVFAELPPKRRLDAINEHLKQDPARVQLAGWSTRTAAR